MKAILLVIITSVLFCGCSPSNQKYKTLRKTEVASVTITDPSPGETTKKYFRKIGMEKTNYDIRIYIELDKDWLKVITVSEYKKNGDKFTSSDYYKPETLLTFSTDDRNK